MSLDPNLAFYSEALEDGADDGQRVGWESSAVQKLRFEALLEALPEADWRSGELTLLDVGCGMGDLVGWLRATGRRCDYTGIDLHPGMVERARARYPEARFEVRDLREVEERYDVVLCSGALSVRLADAEASWALVERMYARCRRVATLNLQSVRVLETGAQLRDDFWLVEPVEAWRRLRGIAKTLTLREDTVPSDLVAYLYRGTCRTLRAARMVEATTPVERAEIILSRREPELARALLERVQPLAEPAREAERLNLLAVAGAMLGAGDVGPLLSAAHEKAPGHLQIAENLASWLLTRGDLAGARSVIEVCLARGEGSAGRRDELRGVLHDALVVASDWEAAEALEASLERGVARDHHAARRLLARGRLRSAREAAERALEATPYDMEVALTLAQVLQRQGDAARALELAAQVLSEAPGEPEARSVALKALRAGAKLRGEARGAFAAVVEALREHPVLGAIVARMG